MRNQLPRNRPSSLLLEAELNRITQLKKNRLYVCCNLFGFTTFICVLILTVVLWFPVFQVHGNSMSPTLRNGDYILCMKTNTLSQGDITVFYHNNKILVKRVIGLPGEEVNIKEDGTVYINTSALYEPYIIAPSVGVGDTPLPCIVPANHFFVLGDHRATSLDSRSTEIGFVPKERVLGKALFRIWPLHLVGRI